MEAIPVNPDLEAKVKAELEKLIHYLLWRIRDVSEEFPYKLRIDVFFSRNEGANSHFIETETLFLPEALRDAEEKFLEWQKQQIVKDASDFMNGKHE
jgi:hypothetical protein